MRCGLAMLWSSDVEVNIVSYNNHHIDVYFTRQKRMKLRCTGVYGHPEGSQKKTHLDISKEINKFVFFSMVMLILMRFLT